MKSEKNLNDRGTEIRSNYVSTMHMVASNFAYSQFCLQHNEAH